MSTDQSEQMPDPSERMPMAKSRMPTSQFKIISGRHKGPCVMIAHEDTCCTGSVNEE